MKPLTASSFDELFHDILYAKPNSIKAAAFGAAYPLLGLPGAVADGGVFCLYVKPSLRLMHHLAAVMPGLPVGSFRCIRSAELMDQGLLPVYVKDFYGWRSVLIATVPYSEHERFAKEGETDAA